MGLLHVIIPALLLLFKLKKNRGRRFQFSSPGVNTFAKNCNRWAHIMFLIFGTPTHISFYLIRFTIPYEIPYRLFCISNHTYRYMQYIESV